MANIRLGTGDGSRLTEGRRIRFSPGSGVRLTAVIWSGRERHALLSVVLGGRNPIAFTGVLKETKPGGDMYIGGGAILLILVILLLIWLF
jgi:hypothetical protein